MALQFHRAVEDMEIWSGSSDGFSFVITFESLAGPGFHGRPGYVASFRPLYQSSGAVRIGGSPLEPLGIFFLFFSAAKYSASDGNLSKSGLYLFSSYFDRGIGMLPVHFASPPIRARSWRNSISASCTRMAWARRIMSRRTCG
jgi:hypothetical protein